MKIAIPKNRMGIKHFSKDFDLDLALVILLTLLCIQTFLWKRKLYQRNKETFSWRKGLPKEGIKIFF